MGLDDARRGGSAFVKRASSSGSSGGSVSTGTRPRSSSSDACAKRAHTPRVLPLRKVSTVFKLSGKAPKEEAPQLARQDGNGQNNRALQIGNDPRCKEIERFSQEHFSQDNHRHFQRLLGRTVLDGRGGPRAEPISCSAPAAGGRAAECGYELRTVHGAEQRAPSRIAWQECFNDQVSRLLDDFDLSEEPSYRLNHFERFYGWFSENGKKQVRKYKPNPNYITLGSDEQLPPGSARHIRTSCSGATRAVLHTPRAPLQRRRESSDSSGTVVPCEAASRAISRRDISGPA